MFLIKRVPFFIVFVLFVMCLFHTNPSFAASSKKIKVTSLNFMSKGIIPDLHACDFIGLNKSPQLSFTNAPSDTQSFALIMFDPDAPDKNFVHWVIFNIPVNSSELEGDITSEAVLENGTKQGKNGTIGYFGPCPPPGETHRYIFKVFAIDSILDLESGATKKELTKTMKGHIVGTGKLVGLYKNNTSN